MYPFYLFSRRDFTRRHRPVVARRRSKSRYGDLSRTVKKRGKDRLLVKEHYLSMLSAAGKEFITTFKSYAPK